MTPLFTTSICSENTRYTVVVLCACCVAFVIEIARRFSNMKEEMKQNNYVMQVKITNDVMLKISEEMIKSDQSRADASKLRIKTKKYHV